MRKVIKVVVLVALFMAIPLTALAQEEGGTTDTVVNIAGTVLFLSLIIQYLVEWVRGRWANLDGDILRVVTIAIGIGAAFAYDLNVSADLGFEGLPEALGYVATGLVIAGVSGFLGTGKNALRARDPKSSINSEPVV